MYVCMYVNVYICMYVCVCVHGDRFQEILESFDQQDVSSEVLLSSLEHYTIKTSFSANYLSQKYTNKAVTLLCRWVQGVAR